MKRSSVSEKLRADAVVLRGTAEQHTAAMRRAQTSFYPNIRHAPCWEDALHFNRELHACVESLYKGSPREECFKRRLFYQARSWYPRSRTLIELIDFVR